MNTQLIFTVLVASLVGSLHCVGMCGGFVAFYSAGAHGRGLVGMWPHAAYHSGRLLTYVSLGILAGTLGKILDFAGKAAGMGRVAAVVAGFVMVTWGLSLLLARAGVNLRIGMRGKAVFPGISRFLAEQLRRLTEKPPIVRALVLGLSSTLLPCGFLYAFVVTAAGTGNAWSGAVVMLSFWSGTVPLLLGFGLGVEQLGVALRRYVPTVTALLLVSLGAYTVIGRVNVSYLIAKRFEAQLAPGNAIKAAGENPLNMPADCPCHRH